MAAFIDARDVSSGAFLATLSCSTFLRRELPFEGGVARRLRSAFVAEAKLSPEQTALFSVRAKTVPNGEHRKGHGRERRKTVLSRAEPEEASA